MSGKSFVTWLLPLSSLPKYFQTKERIWFKAAIWEVWQKMRNSVLKQIHERGQSFNQLIEYRKSFDRQLWWSYMTNDRPNQTKQAKLPNRTRLCGLCMSAISSSNAFLLRERKFTKTTYKYDALLCVIICRITHLLQTFAFKFQYSIL